MIAAIPTPDVSGQIAEHNSSETAHDDIRTAIRNLDTLVGTTKVSTQINNAIASLVDSAPATLDTLNELAAALGDDPNFATTIATQIGGKADAEHTHEALTQADIDEICVYNMKTNGNQVSGGSD